MTDPHVADSTFRTWPQDDFLLPPPNPAQRVDVFPEPSAAPTVPAMPAVPAVASVLDPRDLRRLELNAALTAAGIAPLPGDREAIDQLSALPHTVHEALHRWLTA
ncbi:hypothetical protein RCO28_38895 [Streptomyces sp. LHD-70]|uniref:hypothetical protein n=1 Tax=Streptomyces sp. LHD-70 TaxID=3072140 RepID=UPI00280E6551|nr:hypothetical protein [Streptomyces sp. LHD-70]MDQ8708382.1 hypothetical protein [Streptomyces sp. LHD-70]